MTDRYRLVDWPLTRPFYTPLEASSSILQHVPAGEYAVCLCTVQCAYTDGRCREGCRLSATGGRRAATVHWRHVAGAPVHSEIKPTGAPRHRESVRPALADFQPASRRPGIDGCRQRPAGPGLMCRVVWPPHLVRGLAILPQDPNKHLQYLTKVFGALDSLSRFLAISPKQMQISTPNFQHALSHQYHTLCANLKVQGIIGRPQMTPEWHMFHRFQHRHGRSF